MIGTFISQRILNPIELKNFLEIFKFLQKIDIISDLIWANLGFVVTFWSVRQGKLL